MTPTRNPRRQRLIFGTQNTTEGPVTADLQRCDIAVLQEVDRAQLNAGFGRHEIIAPKRDRHQKIEWNPWVFDVASTGWTPFHRSGEAQGWPSNVVP